MKNHWKNVSIKKISDESGYGTATVDRVLNNRKGVSKKTKDKILNILNNLQNGNNKNQTKKADGKKGSNHFGDLILKVLVFNLTYSLNL